MDIRKKELYEVFADSLEKSRTKEGGLLFDKLFEDMWEHIEPKLGQSLPRDSVSKRFEIDFDGNVLAGIEITNNEPKVFGAMNGWGNGINPDKCKITEKTD